MIPASLIVLVIPLIAAAAAYALRRWQSLEILTAVVSCGAVIFLLARPITNVVTLPGYIIDIDAPLDIIGRTLQVRAADRLPILLLFLSAAIVYTMSWRTTQGWTFVPIGLTVLTAMSAGLMIRPFQYAALAFEAAAALAALMIQAERTGEGTTRGALRYLAIATLALPMFLLAGWVIDRSVNVNPTDAEAIAAAFTPAIILLLIGFGLIFGAVPLFTWIHLVAKDAPPLVTAFLGSVGLSACTFLFLAFWQEYSWLRNSPTVITALSAGGMVMLLFGGGLAWAQSSFSRVMACAILVDAGCTLLVLSSNSQLGVEAIAFGSVARTIALSIFGVGMWRLQTIWDSDEFDAARGTNDLWTTMALGIAGLSLAGLPGTLGFVSRWIGARAYSNQDAEGLAVLLVASASVGVGVMRGLLALYRNPLPTMAPVQPAIVGDQLALFVDDANGMADLPNTAEMDSTDVEFASAPMADAELGVTSSEVNALQSVGMRFVIGTGMALLLIFGLWPGVIAPMAQAVAAQYGFYR
jgi:formate hydrogenlyase subunit 3/multisubunit Na+/H+ antiporter MnhD subunit